MENLGNELDDHLKAIKESLKEVRAQYGIDGDVTYRIRYSNIGDVTRVTIDDGPSNMSPQFIMAANNLVLARLRIPRANVAGELMFTDLGTATRIDPQALNARNDAHAMVVRSQGDEDRRRRNVRIGVVVGVLFVAWQVISVIIQL
ncbi:MAG TPA: hypothetical protein VGM90_04150 [Kofleriaceae bacterium]|jgi:hypothetical protein